MVSERRTLMRRIWVVIILFTMVLVPAVGIGDLPAQADEPPQEIEELQQWVYDQGYNYTVAENWITDLSPEEKEALCGYKHIEAPEGPLPENVRFFSDVPTIETRKFGPPPASYDAMALGYVTPIKNQLACGSCWLHAAMADFESDVAIGESSLLDFSEQEAGDCNIWSTVGGYDFCNGGIALMTTNYLTKYGSADETCHPYVATSETCLGCPLLKNVDNWRMITGGDGQSQITTIKNAILNYGPVYSSIYASGPGFDTYSSGVYEDWSPGSTDHVIEIIGWDDTLSHSMGDGAWMIKNSWGTDWGAGGPYPGCAWVAYGSANLGDDTSAIVSYKNPPDIIFYHDECGWMYYCIGCDDPTAYEAVRFTPSQDLTLTAVDFWAVDVNMSYEIKIFDTLNDLGGGYNFSSQLGTTQSGTTSEQGYYSISLSTPVPLTSGDDFIVQVKLVTTEWGYPIPVDYYDILWLPPWSGIATYSGESYASCDGAQFQNLVLYDVGIRARAEEPPDLVVTEKYEEWVNFAERSYNVTYTVKNQGSLAASASETRIYIDAGSYDEHYSCPALDPGDTYSNTVGLYTMSGDSDTIEVCADVYTAVDESNEENNCRQNTWGTLITGVTCAVNCDTLAGVTITLYDDDVVKGTATSDGSGNYTLPASISEPGEYEVVASKTGYKDESQPISITGLGQEYELNFRGDHGLIPDTDLGMERLDYFLHCMNLYLKDWGECNIGLDKFLATMNAYLKLW